MRRLLPFLILGASLTACSTTPREYPTCDIPGPSPDVGHALSVPEMPSAASSTKAGATFDLDGLLQLDRVRKAGMANSEIAEENALALEARNDEVNALIECARYQNVWIQVHAEDLKDEKRAHFLTEVKYLAGIGIGILAAVL